MPVNLLQHNVNAKLSICMYVATPDAKNSILEETFPSDLFAATTRLPKVIGYIYVTTYAMSFLPNRIDQLSSRTSFLPTNSS